MLIGIDEYLNPQGDWIAEDDPLSFRGHVHRRLWAVLDPALAPPPEHRVFPHPARLAEVPELIERHGGVDVCFAGVGIAGHLAFNEPDESADEAEFASRSTRVVTLAPETRTINAVTAWGGAIRRIPPRAVTLGMREISGRSQVAAVPNPRLAAGRAARGAVRAGHPRLPRVLHPAPPRPGRHRHRRGRSRPHAGACMTSPIRVG